MDVLLFALYVLPIAMALAVGRYIGRREVERELHWVRVVREAVNHPIQGEPPDQHLVQVVDRHIARKRLKEALEKKYG